jgi:PKD repeat protein
MAKARAIIVVVVLAVLLCTVGPTYVLAAPPGPPTNVSPAGGTTDISLTPTLTASAFVDGDAGSSHLASQWQVSTASDVGTDGKFTSFVFDNGVSDTGSLIGVQVDEGCLTYATTYYWHVRYQDETQTWGAWSAATSFTTAAAGTGPETPANASPADDAVGIVLEPTLVASAFAMLNGIGTHAYSQWEIATSDAGFTAAAGLAGPIYDSLHVEGATTMTVDEDLLDYEATYFWSVRYQDSYGNWSSWSQPTSFTTIENRPPYQPSNESPASGATGVPAMATLRASSFSDPDDGDSQAASQWQITATSGDYTAAALVWDSGTERIFLRQITVPSGELASGTTYYWKVRYQDRQDNWSGWSNETSFSTVPLAAPVASFEAVDNVTEVVALKKAAVFVDTTTDEFGDIYLWEWDFGDGTTATWTVYDRPRDLMVSHTYAEGGDYTVTLTVTNSADSDSEVKESYIHVLAAPEAKLIAFPTVKAGENASFTDVSTGGITSWTWNFGDGTVVVWDAENRPADGKITHKYSDGGSKVVTLSVTGPLGDSTANKTVEVTGGEGWFQLWMAIVAGVLVVAAIALFVLRQRMGKKAAGEGKAEK